MESMIQNAEYISRLGSNPACMVRALLTVYEFKPYSRKPPQQGGIPVILKLAAV